jgi:uncharacterized protein (DUF952 family)
MLQSDSAWILRARIQNLERQVAILRNHVEAIFGPAPNTEQLAFESHFQPEILYHITATDYFAKMLTTDSYLPPGYAQDGFIHCTRGVDLLVLVANRHFKNVTGEFLMLVIDPQRLTAPLKYEALDRALPYPFPHIYGPLNRDAIIEVVKMIRAADGTFLAPPFTGI